MSHDRRKAEHIRINLEEDVQSARVTNGLEHYRLIHCALPEVDLDAVDTDAVFLGHSLRVPLLISSMTGGTAAAAEINRNLAMAAQARGIAMALGSQRAGLERPESASTFQVRDVAPDAVLFANLGAVQLNYGYSVEHCRRAVEMIQADALILHLNPLQEALQEGGDGKWSGLLGKIETICREVDVPVVVKEVGWGIGERVARQLASVGVSAIDVAGAGGTSWSEVEMYRASTASQRRLAAAFSDWGLPTAEALLQSIKGAPEVPVVASGGIRSGTEVAKALALGAGLVGMASPFLKAAAESGDSVLAVIDDIVAELRIAMFACGAGTLAALQTPIKVERVCAGVGCADRHKARRQE